MEKAKKYVWRQVPLFRILWPFILGIGLGIHFGGNIYSLYLHLTTAFLAVLGFIYFKHRRSSLVLLLAFASIGFVVASSTAGSDEAPTLVDSDYEKASWFIETTGRTELRKNRFRVIGVVKDGPDNSHSIEAAKVLVYLETDSLSEPPGFGDLVAVHTQFFSINAPPNPGMFDYKKYMASKGEAHQGFVEADHWKIVRKGDNLKAWFTQLHFTAVDCLTSNSSWDRESAILSALLLGNKSFLEMDQKTSFAKAGAMHVLAVSGLHVGIIYLVLLSLFKPLSKSRSLRIIKAILILLSLWAFAGITGFSPSVVRSSTMFSFMAVAGLIDRKSGGLNSLVASAILILTVNPKFLLDVGFQLSYVAVAGIMIIHPKLYGLWKCKWIVVDKLWSLTAVSIAAQIATFPLGIYYFHQFPNYFLLSNWIVIPAVSIILPMGMLMISMAWVPELFNLLELLVYTSIRWLGKAISWISDLPMSTIHSMEISSMELIFLYCAIVAVTGFLITKRFKFILASLCILCALQASRLVESVKNRNQVLIAIYSVPEHETMDLVQGSFVSSLFSSEDIESEIDYYVSPFRSLLNVEPMVLDSSFDTISSYRGLNLLHLTDSMEIIDSIQAIDVLHIQGRTAQSAETVFALTEPELVVLSQNLTWKVRAYWIGQCKKLNYAYHDLKTDGAYIRQLN